MKLEVLHVQDCPNLATLLDRLREVTDLPVVTHQVDTDEEASSRGMAGSPTLLVDGMDPFATRDQLEGVLFCRIYRDEGGRMTGAPSVEQLRHALAAADSRGLLSIWRTRALPLEPVERAVHQAILRAFAATGHAPTSNELDEVTAGTETSTEAVLQSLHEGDAIRLAPDGVIAVAYPFSATPTRHRVRIGDSTDVYAMCAVDALGMAAMLGQDTVITSVDVTSDQPVSVATTGQGTVWEPADSVVVIGADAGGGPSAECCCDHVNFFSDPAAAGAWIGRHAQVCGQVLSQTEAELIARVDGAAGSALGRLEEAIAVREALVAEADRVTDHVVGRARESGESWTAIGDRLGISKQAARQRLAVRVHPGFALHLEPRLHHRPGSDDATVLGSGGEPSGSPGRVGTVCDDLQDGEHRPPAMDGPDQGRVTAP